MTQQAGPDGGVQAPGGGAPRPGGAGPRGPVARRALWLGIGSLVAAFLFPPFALVLGIAAIVVERKARREPVPPGTPPRSGLSASIVTGAIAIVLAVASMSLGAYLRTEIADFTECKSSANTVSDEDACTEAFNRAFEKKMGFSLLP
ncbi:hypothetical protein [Actinomadura atramentaria]|uniref:hypothetical protein n=1 Tax=Actinomadura atramentaria TaxID=1990 RepID=UPI00039D1047|nr:hypothetical protein [Actinomadura atramentaria]